MICPSDSFRVGGEFEFDPSEFCEKYNSLSSVGLDGSVGMTLWTDTGRSALLIAARAILKSGGSGKVWLPAYGCKSVSQPFIQAGYEIEYYSLSYCFMGEPQDAPEMLEGDTLLFNHYFGHRNKLMIDFSNACRTSDVWIIEDCVQSSLDVGVGMNGDFSVRSYRKVLPSPDGATLDVHRKSCSWVAISDLEVPDESFISSKLLGKVFRAGAGNEEIFLPLLEASENKLEAVIVPRQVSQLSKWMLSRIDIAQVIKKRQANWRALSKCLCDAELGDCLHAVFNSLSEGEVPLGFPVIVLGKDRDGLRKYLLSRKIYCPVHWSLEHLPDDSRYDGERQIALTILTLPIDQRMNIENIEYMAGAIKCFFRIVQ